MLKSEHHQKAIFALIIANIIWGAASPIFKLALSNFPPFSLAFLRFFGGMLLLFPFVRKNLQVKKEDWLNLLLLSLFGISINISFFFLGLERAPSINAPIIASSGPVFLYLFAIIFLREKPHRKVFIGLVVSLIGVLTIVIQPLIEKGFTGNFIGNVFFVLATFGAVGHAIFSKKIIYKYQPITITFWSFWIGMITFIPFFSYELVNSNPFLKLDYRGFIGIFYGIIFSSTLAYFLFEWGIKRIQAQETGLFTYIDPLAAIIIAVPFLGEKITPVFTIGSILVLTGIMIAEGRLQYHPFQKLRR